MVTLFRVMEYDPIATTFQYVIYFNYEHYSSI